MKRYIGVVVAVMFLGVGSALAVPAQKTPGKEVDVNIKVLGQDVFHAEFGNKSKMSNVHNELKIDGKVITSSGNMDLGVIENKSGGEMRNITSEIEINNNATILNGGEGKTRVGNMYNN